MLKDLEKWNLVKQGAEAKVYKGLFLEKAAILKQRFAKQYRHPTLDVSLTKERIKSEVKALARCRHVGIKTPAVYYVDLEDRFIVMEDLVNTITLRDHIRDVLKKCARNSDEIAEKLFPLMRLFGEILCKLHQHSIIHGDLTTSNAMINTESSSVNIFLIDFGLSSISDSAESKAVDLYVLERAFLSSHPNSEIMFDELLKAYKGFSSRKDTGEVMKKLDEVRLRGRKRSMVG